ncbi:6129_t:CDS:1, partial [Gigaspora rosea]
NDLKKRQTSLGQGQHCTGANDDSKCDTQICRIKGEDTYKCQLTDERGEGENCINNYACKIELICAGDNKCRFNE